MLSPRGLELTVADAPGLLAAVGHGMKVLAVVADEAGTGFEVRGARAEVEADAGLAPQVEGNDESTRTSHLAPRIPSPDESPRTSHLAPPLSFIVDQNRPRPWGRLVAAAFALTAAVLAILFWRDLRTFIGKLDFGVHRADEAAAAATVDSARLPPAALAEPPAVESLPFAVEVRSGRAMPAALLLADSLESRHVPAIVAPIRLRGAAALWRVYAGPYASLARADSALTALHAAGVIAANDGVVDSVPMSFALAGGLTRDAALAERARLRAAGVPTFILGQADGNYRLYAGAYEASTQAALLQDLLTPTGSAGILLPRAGTVP